VDGLVVVSEPSMRSLRTAAGISTLAKGLGLSRQALVVNRAPAGLILPESGDLPPLAAAIPVFPSLAGRQITDPSVLDLAERDEIDRFCAEIIGRFDRGVTP
jgi:CO dehydrogenase maturation factor